MKLVETRDIDVIRRIAKHPAVWHHIIDDDTPGVVDLVDNYRYVLVTQDFSGVIGMFVMIPIGAAIDIHICMLPIGYGFAEPAARMAFKWVWDNTQCQRIFAMIPEYNRLAMKLAQRVGMTYYWLARQSIKFGDKWHSRIIFSLRRPSECRS